MKQIIVELQKQLENNVKAHLSILDLSADIENIINQSAIHAVKNNHEKIKKKDITDAYDEVMIGIKKKDRIMSDEERNAVV